MLKRPLVAAAVIALTAVPAWADGAIALGACSRPGTGYGFAYGQPSAAVAQSLALGKCSEHTTECKILVQFAQRCFALALDFSRCGPVGAAEADDLASAKTAASQACTQTEGGKDCRIVAANCAGAVQVPAQTRAKVYRCVPWRSTPLNSNCGASGHEACPHSLTICHWE
jgi:Domain of unknown function (DUF4189)